MKITYDPEVDALYIRFADAEVQVTTQRLSEDVAVNYGPDGDVVGIEILDASEHAFGGTGDRTVEVRNLASVTAL